MFPLFGTDGIRKAIGKEPLTPDGLFNLGKALGKWLTQTTSTPTIALGHDTRYSSSLCKAALKTGLLCYPVTLLDYCVVPTPVLFHRVSKQDFTLGIMITASHNPSSDNGIKLFTQEGKLSKKTEKIITGLFYETDQKINYEHLGRESYCNDTPEQYTQLLEQQFEKKFLKGLKIVIDCANGAYSQLAPQILKLFGAEVITLSVTPNGKNINANCGSLYPQNLQKEVIKQNAHFGFAFDGDGDRVVAVSKKGELKNGDDLLALLSGHKAYESQSVIIGTVMSNEGLADYFTKKNKTFLRTPVGDKYVIQELKKQKAFLGGEISGHTILGDFGYTADGLFTALRLIQLVQETNNWKMKSFKKFPQVMINVPVIHQKDLTQEPFFNLINEYEQSLQGGRLLIRYSGTEPVLRVMVETADLKQAEQVGQNLSQKLTVMLQS